jgi:hypothetical protein
LRRAAAHRRAPHGELIADNTRLNALQSFGMEMATLTNPVSQ